MSIYLAALALRHYRGIDENWQFMPGFRRFNFFIGANNSGKSTVLNFISKYLPPQLPGFSGGKPQQVDPIEIHSGQLAGAIEMAFGLPAEHIIERTMEGVGRDVKGPTLPLVSKLIDSISHNGTVWISNKIPYQAAFNFLSVEQNHSWESVLPAGEWQRLWNYLTHAGQGDLRQHWIPETIEFIRRRISINLPKVKLVPAIREIGPRNHEFGDYSGKGLIDRLAEIQSPDHDRRSDRVIFDNINKFLQDVTGNPEANIEIPHNRLHVLVHMNNRVLPLSSLGTGIHEVIMIAAFCTISSKEIVCIEEPEIHLHPLLQRKLISYLEKYTENQYFIATHSPSFIDTVGAAIFHVSLKDNNTHIREAILRSDRQAICMDLGHRASEIMQTNCVIWVEGPSDRIYLNHWISATDALLLEGTHYSIMFYGGRLLNHLSAQDKEITEFIDLRALNRNVVVLMDSDKSSPYSKVNETKQRIKMELESDGGMAWITKGREIENYVDHVTLQSAVKSQYPDVYDRASGGGAFDRSLEFWRKAPKKSKRVHQDESLLEKSVDKVKIARTACSVEPNFGILDLGDRVNKLVEYIRSANP